MARNGGVRATDDPVTDLLERESAWAEIDAALSQAAAGRGSLVSIEGEAGIGKTALVLKFLDARRAVVRCFLGGCEHLSAPEALGPLHDIARESQGRFRVSADSQLATFDALLRLLKGGRGPALLLIEDIHWADNATLDCLRFLARRLREAAVLAIVTLRDDDAQSRPRLAALWNDIPRDMHQRIVLRALSPNSVAAMAANVVDAPANVYAMTGGNPFLVTEYLAAGAGRTPACVRDATLSRADLLTQRARHVLDCAAIFPRRVDAGVLRAVSRDAADHGLSECLQSAMLQADGQSLSFRHELARRTVEEALTPLRRRKLHGEALAFLKKAHDVSAAQKAHHAERAGALGDFIGFSIEASRGAARAGAHREAVAHLSRALQESADADPAERVEWLEALAASAELSGELELAASSIDQAIALRRSAGDLPGLGNALRLAARISWVRGEVELADAQSSSALAVLRAIPDSWQFAMALSGQSQLDMLADRFDTSIRDGEAAMLKALHLGRWDIYVHAATNVAMARCGVDVKAGLRAHDDAIAEALQRQQPDFLPRLYSNKAFIMIHERIYDGLFETLDAGLAAARARDNAIEIYLRGSRALALIDRGNIQQALVEAEAVLASAPPRGTPIFTAQTAVSRSRVRLGLPEKGIIDAMRTLPGARRDLLRMVPIALCDAEAAWLRGTCKDAAARLRAVFERTSSGRWTHAESALWLAILGERVTLDDAQRARLPAAHRAHIDGAWAEAAEHWRALGCPYERAIALSNGNEQARREALAVFDSLGAQPAARNLRRALRASGIRSISIGPRAARRKHAAGLTARQQQVLSLIVLGLTNTEIAQRLRLSPKTAENHVAAVLAALGAPNRGRAAQIARERGLHESPDPAVQ